MRGVPNLHCMLSHFYVETLVTWYPLNELGKNNYLAWSGVPPINFLKEGVSNN